MLRINYKKFFSEQTSDELMDFDRAKLKELSKDELVKVCYAMLSCIIDLKKPKE